ncbi:hypothetical protein [Clostridium pasteurianum]|uniref:DUF3168 domain-containing protein n=1 Tax=Clostridium pasteurianum BC1 TaxID=86416 RepID=R4K132_CLOPA|nr:hypothetical protein [Clostridium pasteurianum]AGK96802.1 hypothetical protein Clopa_1902 [Clostridium pasteurianum BC1]
MQDNTEIFTILNAIASTEYQYPQSLVTASTNGQGVPADFFPVISYFDSNHNAMQYQDGKSIIEDIEYTVDVWERANPNTGELISIYSNVDKALRDNGYRRITFANLYETVTQINHYSMRYKKAFEET